MLGGDPRSDAVVKGGEVHLSFFRLQWPKLQIPWELVQTFCNQVCILTSCTGVLHAHCTGVEDCKSSPLGRVVNRGSGACAAARNVVCDLYRCGIGGVPGMSSPARIPKAWREEKRGKPTLLGGHGEPSCGHDPRGRTLIQKRLN